jgi:hypothetical protein
VAVVVRVGVGDRLRLARASVALVALDEVDDVWTSYLDAATRADVDAERADVIELGRSLQTAIADARDGLTTIVEVLESTPETSIDAAVAAMRAQSARAMGLFDEAFAPVLDEYSVRGLLIDACLFLREQLPSDAADVASKVGSIEAGTFTEGDLPLGTKCAIQVAILAAAVADLAISGGTATHLALSASSNAGALALSWDDCKTSIGSIWRRLRR